MANQIYKMVVAFLMVCIGNNLCTQVRADNFYIKDSVGNAFPQSAYDSMSKVKTIKLVPVKSNGRIEGYTIQSKPYNNVAFVPDGKIYNLAEVNIAENKIFKIGGPMPKYKFKDMEGKVYNSDSMRGKVVHVAFWHKACSPCIQEMPVLNGLKSYYANNSKMIFLAPSLDDSLACANFLQRTNYDYHVIPSSRKIAEKWDISSCPRHIVIDKQGKIVLYSEGYVIGLEQYVNQAIKNAMGK
ncbi:MAG: TlpA disulfide reductase family protein [Bacteroidota bacterium]|nr:TlpA disulfide reductase family protein [Bacteroidota bacterium]